jgi:hypothetical protein
MVGFRRMPAPEQAQDLLLLIERCGVNWIIDHREAVESTLKIRLGYGFMDNQKRKDSLRASWRYSRRKVMAALAVKFPKLARLGVTGKCRQEYRKFIFLLNRIGSNKPLSPAEKRKMRHFIKFADKELYDGDLSRFIGFQLELHTDLVNINYENKLNPLAELENMAEFLRLSFAGIRGIIPQSVCEKLFDEDFNGDPWAPDPDYYLSEPGLSADDLRAEMQATEDFLKSRPTSPSK